MSERYSRVFTLPANLYTPGSPVVIEAGALLKDNNNGHILAQLKLKNIVPRTIKAVTVRISPLDITNQPLGEPVIHQYLDLQAQRDTAFCHKTAVDLPDAATRGFNICVEKVVFTDNSTWDNTEEVLESLIATTPLESLRHPELEKQFRLEYGSQCKYFLSEQKDLWFCPCGALNHQQEKKCHICGTSHADVQAVDMDVLREHTNQRLEQEKIEARRKAEAAEKEAKHRKKIAAIVTLSLLIFIGLSLVTTKVIIPNTKYHRAVTLMEQGQYDEAIDVFQAMDGFKDSVDKIEDCRLAAKYNRGLTLMDNGQYSEAITVFQHITDYLDSAEQINLCQDAILKENYNAALTLMEQGQYEEAISAFQLIEDYSDSTERIQFCEEAILEEDYNAALTLMEQGQYEKAISAFQLIEDYSDSAEQIQLCEDAILRAEYDDAVALMESGRTAEAAFAFSAMDYADSAELCQQCWKEIQSPHNFITLGCYHTVGLKKDGTVVTAGNNHFGQCNTATWTDIVSVVAGWSYTVGLKSDGTVVAAGANSYGQCDVEDWSNIIAVSAKNSTTVGLRSDGTVVAVGSNEVSQCDVSAWTNIISIDSGFFHTVGLKADGTVVTVGDNDYGQRNVYWKDIVAVSASFCTVGLKSDGTVVAAGNNDYGQCDVAGWRNITSIATGAYHTVGLKSDGTVVAVGNNEYGQCDVSDWNDIVAIAAGAYQTVGLKSDGTVVATGCNEVGQCDVSSFKNIQLP